MSNFFPSTFFFLIVLITNYFRMQKVFAVQYSGDASYILCGSDDTNIRVWKAQAARNTALVCET